MTKILILIIIISCTVLNPSWADVLFGYVIETNSLYRIIPEKKEFMFVVNPRVELGNLAFGPDGFIYGNKKGTSQIYKLDINSGKGTLLAQLGFPIKSLAFDPGGALFLVSSEPRVYVMDFGTGVARSVVRLERGADILAFSESGILFAYEESSNKLYTVDLDTGRFSLVTETEKQLASLIFDSNGVLFGTDKNSNLYAVNIENGSFALIGKMDHDIRVLLMAKN